jgi:GNAT superfamily N-acetyltransferase
MPQTNFEKMIALADEFFDVKNDPEQIAVTEEVISRLRRIHPATMGEVGEEGGPVAWMLVIPTPHALMEQFIRKEISERQLLELTSPDASYEALYLCSALVLPEHRGKGLAKGLATGAIRAIQRDHPIRELFYWGFSQEGERLAESVARESGLPLLRREG